MAGDTEKLGYDKWDGDASTTLFPLSNKPVKDASYVVKISGATQTEVTHYSLDKDLGFLTFVSAPAAASDNTEITYRYYTLLRDVDWLEVTNNGIKNMREDFWVEVTDTSSLTSVANQVEYDLSSVSANIIAVPQCWYRQSTSYNWLSLGTDTNWRYLQDKNVLMANPPIDTTGYLMKLFYLKTYTLGATTSATLEVQEKYHNVLKYLCLAEYYERLIPIKLTETTVVTKERTFEPSTSVIRAAQYYRNLAEKERARVRPKRPTYVIRNILAGISS